jgi:hypothetical protein
MVTKGNSIWRRRRRDGCFAENAKIIQPIIQAKSSRTTTTPGGGLWMLDIN